jgi:broad specificity phosphatase PhoE
MTMKTIINTIRHAQTCYSAENRYAGTIDISLSEEGVLQSRQAAIKLSEINFDVVISSALKRAIETTQILVGHQKPIIQSKLCVERNFGIFEGMTRAEIENIVPPVLWISVGQDTHSVNQQGSEPFEKVWQRAIRFRNWLFRTYAGLNILVVSHGVFLQMFNGLLRGQNCIESLGTYPAPLELASFFFDGRHLVDESRTELINTKNLICF